MNKYVPDTWVVLEFDDGFQPIHKVFAGWYGGFAGSDEWRLNSGIKEVIEHDNYYEFVGYSGSVYHCNKNSQKMSLYQSSVLADFQSSIDIKVKIIDYECVRN